MRTEVNLGYEEGLWSIANALRGSMSPSDYKYVVLSLLFLKFISKQDSKDRKGFHVREEASWGFLQSASEKNNLRASINKAISLLERDNPSLKDAFPNIFREIDIREEALKEALHLVDKIPDTDSSDTLGRIYEYVIGKFASIGGKEDGEFFTPKSVVKLLVEMVEPYKGKIYDPCCGTGGLFIQSERFLHEHGKNTDLQVFGQEQNPYTWKLAKMNLIINGVDSNLGIISADTLRNDQHPDLKANFILANPPFNLKNWGAKKLENDPRWVFGNPPDSNANFAWIQHMLAHLTDDGVAGFVLANGALSTNHGGIEGEIRKKIIESDLVDCVVALPTQLFYTTQISASLWFLNKNKKSPGSRERSNATLFIDARDLGYLVDKTHRNLTNQEIGSITNAYTTWKSKKGNYKDQPGFCKSVSLQDIRDHKWSLVPGRYVGFKKKEAAFKISELQKEFESFEKKFKRITSLNTDALKTLKKLIHG